MNLFFFEVKAMERIEEIKQKRQTQFIMNRLKVGEDNRTEEDLREVKDFMHLIKAPHGNLRKTLRY
jgi:large subunit ribosomal protein L24e